MHSVAAHTVVIKGVKLFQNGANVEYSDLDMLQMIGRAVCFEEHSSQQSRLIISNRVDRNLVRKFAITLHLLIVVLDTEGVAIILCESELAPKYTALTRGETEVESCLHLNLSEHLNSEIGTKTISSFEGAK
jgi:ATP-dependent DNA helicase HFM1/MER3